MKLEELQELSDSKIDKIFQKAVRYIRDTPAEEDTTDEMKLEFYSLYKQATEGDNSTPQPWGFAVVKRAKWDAWTNQKGKSKRNAKADYIVLLQNVRGIDFTIKK